MSLPSIALAALNAQRVQQAEERLKAGPLREGEDNLIFTDQGGRPLTSSSVIHSLHHLQAQAGLRRQRFQDLRHCAASLLLAQGLGLREIMEVLGHSTIALTANLYTHLAPAMMRDAAARMDKALAFAEA